MVWYIIYTSFHFIVRSTTPLDRGLASVKGVPFIPRPAKEASGVSQFAVTYDASKTNLPAFQHNLSKMIQ